MAFTIRTIDQIFQELLLEKQNFINLNSLDPGVIIDEATLITALENKQAAEWVLWLYNTAVATHLTEIALQTGIDDILKALETQIVPTAKFYVSEALKFQYGDTVIIDPITYQPSYILIDPNKQIIASATTEEVQNVLKIKVRRVNSDILSNDEKEAFVSYMNKIKPAGTQLLVENYSGDLFTLNIVIVYDGTLSLFTVKTNVETTINDYLNNLEFNSEFLTSTLIDKLQATVGVIDPRFNESSAIDPLSNETFFLHNYQTLSGYGKINPSTPLSSTITYVVK